MEISLSAYMNPLSYLGRESVLSRAMVNVRARRIDLRSGVDGFFEDRVAVDAVIRLEVNGEILAWFDASPEMLRELGVGYLLSEGFAGRVEEILKVDVKGKVISVEMDKDLRGVEPRYHSIGCGLHLGEDVEIPRVTSDLRVSPGDLLETSNTLTELGLAGRSTGGVHSALLYDYLEGSKAFAEDVGRHNAVDKVIGLKALKGQGGFGDSILLTSGRQSGEVVLKAANMGIPIIASFKAPTYTGISMAEMTGITLVGFLRGKRMTVYTNPTRILPIDSWYDKDVGKGVEG